MKNNFIRPLRGKRGLEFSFTWLFALIAGAIILFLAIYGAVRFGGTLRIQSDTEIAKQITILTDPLQAGFAEGSFAKIKFQQDTRVINNCIPGGFGRNEISVQTHSRVGDEWQESGGAVATSNKYIFSSLDEGKDYYVFSKQFKFPYKIADLIFLSSKDYCFVEPPSFIEDEIIGLGIDNIEINSLENCSVGSVRVCFASGDCEIVVYENYVDRNGERLPYVEGLMYGAIFSSPEVYECNVERILYRGKIIADVLSKKSDLMNARGANTNLKPDLIALSQFLEDADMFDIVSLDGFVKELDGKNNREGLGLW